MFLKQVAYLTFSGNGLLVFIWKYCSRHCSVIL